jgi:hypothetical protein
MPVEKMPESAYITMIFVSFAPHPAKKPGKAKTR